MTMDPTTPVLLAGTHVMEVVCPRRKQRDRVVLALRATLTVPDDDAATLRVRCKSKPLPHICGQTALLVDGHGVLIGDVGTGD